MRTTFVRPRRPVLQHLSRHLAVRAPHGGSNARTRSHKHRQQHQHQEQLKQHNFNALLQKWSPASTQRLGPAAASQLRDATMEGLNRMDLRDVVPLVRAVSESNASSHVRTPVLDGAADVVMQRLSTSVGSPSFVASMAHAFAQAAHPSPALFNALGSSAAANLGDYRPRHLGTLSWAMAAANTTTCPELFASRQFADVLDVWTREGAWSDTELSQLHQWTLWCNERNLVHGTDVQPLPAELEVLCRDTFGRHPTSPSHLQQSVVAELNKVGLSPQEEVRIPEGYTIDMLVSYESLSVAIEVDGPTHFLGESERPNGATLLKRRQLHSLGYTLLPVPYYEFGIGDEYAQIYAAFNLAEGLKALVGPTQAAFRLLKLDPEHATPEAAKAAYHSALLANHPDVNPGDADAMERTRAVIDAYRTILRSTSSTQRQTDGDPLEHNRDAMDNNMAQDLMAELKAEARRYKQRKLQEADEAAQRASAPSEGRGEAKLVRERQRARAAEEAAARRRVRAKEEAAEREHRRIQEQKRIQQLRHAQLRAEELRRKRDAEDEAAFWATPLAASLWDNHRQVWFHLFMNEADLTKERTFLSEKSGDKVRVEVPDLYVASLESHGIQVYGGHYTDRRAGFYSDARARLESVIEDIDVIVKGRDAMMKDPDVLAALHKAGFMATLQSRASRKNWRYVIIDRRRLRTTTKAIILAALATAGAVYWVCDRLPPRTADDQLRDFIYGHDREIVPVRPAFVASTTFDGARPGYVFRAGPEGVGYYDDTPPPYPFFKRVEDAVLYNGEQSARLLGVIVSLTVPSVASSARLLQMSRGSAALHFCLKYYAWATAKVVGFTVGYTLSRLGQDERNNELPERDVDAILQYLRTLLISPSSNVNDRIGEREFLLYSFALSWASPDFRPGKYKVFGKNLGEHMIGLVFSNVFFAIAQKKKERERPTTQTFDRKRG